MSHRPFVRRHGVVTLMAIVCLAAATPIFAQATQSDQFNTSSRRGGGNIVADAEAWWANPTGHTDEFRTQTAHCRGVLEEAEGHRQTGMRYYDESRAPGLPSAERTRLNRLFQSEYAIVTRLVRQFYVCARARPVRDRSNTTSPAREAPATQPPQTEPRRGDRIDTDDKGRPRQAPQQPQTEPRRGDQIDTGDNGRPQPARQRPQQALPQSDQIDTSGDKDCLPVPSPQLRAALQVEGNEALRTMAICGAECDYTLTLWARLAAARLVHLTQPYEGLAAGAARAAPILIRDAAKAVATYMVNDNAANHRQLLAQAQAAITAADRAVRQAARTPELSLARVGNAVLFARLTPGPVRRCAATAVRVDLLTREVDEARRAVQVAKEIEAREQAIARDVAKMPCAAPFGSGAVTRPTTSPHAGARVNPTGSLRNCVAVSVAAAKREKTGLPYLAADEAPPYGGVFKMLRENFGDELFPELKTFEQKLHAAGVPRVLDQGGIEAELRAAAAAGVDKPQGIVFVTRPSGAQGHAFNAVWENGRVTYKDYQRGVAGQPSFDASHEFQSASDSYFYRVH